MKRIVLLALPLVSAGLFVLAGCAQKTAVQPVPQMTETTCPCGGQGKAAFQTYSADGTKVQQFCGAGCQGKVARASGATVDMTCPVCGHAGSTAFMKTSGDGKTVHAFCGAKCMALQAQACQACQMSGGMCDACKAKLMK